MQNDHEGDARASTTGRPVGIDLFAGAGGLTLGFEQAGFDVVAAVEIDPIHCATHEYNFPLCQTICASVVDLTGQEIRERASLGQSEIDVVFGGAPCQGFSMIGKRALDDPRNHLVFHFVRLVRELQPKYCVFENVKGLTVGKHAQFLAELIAELEASGYRVLKPYRVLNAADHGVPQDRKRLFLIAARSGCQLPEYPVPRPNQVCVGDAISDLPDADAFEELRDVDEVRVRWSTRSAYAKRLRNQLPDDQDFSYQRLFDAHRLTASARTLHSEVSQRRFAQTPPGETEQISRFLRLSLDGRCNTLRAGTDSARGAFTSPRPIHPVYPRVLTVREAARLHSYPDWFRFHATKWHGFRQIGNSVPPILGRAVAAQVMASLGVLPIKPSRILQQGLSSLLNCDMSQAARYYEVPHDVIAQRQRRAPVAQDLFEPLELVDVD